MRKTWSLLAFCLTLAANLARAQDVSGLELAAGLEKSLVAAIARCEASVVAIARVRKDRPGETFHLEFRPDPFGQRNVPPVAAAPTDPDFLPNEYATGVVVERRGLILTVCHVLSGDSDYYVTTRQHRTYRATIKAADPRSDLAVLAIDAADLPPIPLGDAGQLKKGQIVLALGNPYGIGRDGQASAGWGIVANLARKSPPLADEPDAADRPTIHQFGTLIQTDARLNQGTSGGALVDLQGAMVGLTIVPAGVPGEERSAGYAIPVDGFFRRVLESLKEGREVEYGFLGIHPTNLKPAEIFEGKQGTRVQNVVTGTPAERAGLKADDLITAVGELPIHDSDGLMREVGRMPAGAVTRLSVLRGGSPIRVEVTLAKYPVRGKKVVTNPGPSWRGLRIDYTTAVVDAYSTSSGGFDEGAIITDVEQGTPAWKGGLRPGMIITQVDQQAIRDPRQFWAAVNDRHGPVTLRSVDRDGEAKTTHTVAAP